MYENIIEQLPKMKCGNELEQALTNLPYYNDSIRKKSIAERLLRLSDIYDVYIPYTMSYEIYNKLYLSIVRSLQKKNESIFVKQQIENRKMILQQESSGIIGGADSFTIIGISGIGKSTSINKALSLITENKLIELQKPYTKIIPYVIVQCPFDSSIKGLLLEILRKVDTIFDTNYYGSAIGARATVDMLIGSVAQVSLNHIGLLIVDEIQNVVNRKNGKGLIGALTQIINSSGISVCMVGTPESIEFFEQMLHLARRSLGLMYKSMEYDEQFVKMCKTLLHYQYIKNKSAITEGIITWIYEHSYGVISNVISLIHDAQEIAMVNGNETVCIETLSEAYQKRMTTLHGYKKAKKNCFEPKKEEPHIVAQRNDEAPQNTISIFDTITEIKQNRQSDNVVNILKQYINITEVAI